MADATFPHARHEHDEALDDVHALGVIWFQLITGDLAQTSIPTDWREQLVERGVGDDLIRLLGACVAPKAEKRPAHASVLIQQIEDANVPTLELAEEPVLRELVKPDKPRPAAPKTVRPEKAPRSTSPAGKRAATKVPAATATARAMAAKPRSKGMLLALIGGSAALVTAVAIWAGIGMATLKRPAEQLDQQHSAPAPVTVDALIREMKFVKVPKGTFWMSDGDNNAAEQVTIAQDFELAAYCVTQAQWQQIMGENPSKFSRNGESRDEVANVSDAELNRFPVESVSWDDVRKFLEKLNAQQQGSGYKYRVPRASEWEYACRGAANSKEDCSWNFYIGEKKTNDLSSMDANFDGHYPAGNAAKGECLRRPARVGSYPQNALGLYDMHGNVWQWCGDFADYRNLSPEARGGSWYGGGRYCRADSCNRLIVSPREHDIGCRLARVVLTPPPVKEVSVPPGEDDALIRAMQFVKVPKGTFWMGWMQLARAGETNAVVQVTIEQDFQLAAYCVTQAQWQQIMGENPSWFSRNGKGSDKVANISDAELNRFPVESVSWDDVQKFLEKLNAQQQGKGWKYRLPKEAEWEYACRGAAKSKEDCCWEFYIGPKKTNDLSSSDANFNGYGPFGNAPPGKYLERPAPVGSYPQNPLGLYDMHGNVEQWCEDFYDNRDLGRVIRGGSWYYNGWACQAARRSPGNPSYRGSSGRGCRLARVPFGG